MGYNELKSKWLNNKDFGGLDNLTKDSYCIRLSDFGETGPCSSSMEMTIVLENELDALGLLLFVEIPHIVDYDADPNSNETIRPIEEALKLYSAEDKEKKDRIVKCMQTIESVLKKGNPGKKEIDDAFTLFNETFEETNPTVEVKARGYLADYLKDAYFAEDWDDSDEEDAELLELKALLKSNKFDTKNEKHMELAVYWLESIEKY